MRPAKYRWVTDQKNRPLHVLFKNFNQEVNAQK